MLAFNPDQSKLVNMLRARGTAARMPPDRPMSEADISLVESWISFGARETPGGPPANYVPLVDAGGGSDAGSDTGVGADTGAASDGGGDAGAAD